jgi:hypothetical protein
MKVSLEKQMDLRYGLGEEEKVLPVLRDHLQRNDIVRNPDPMGPYDFYRDIDEHSIETWELKSRKYPSTERKIQEGVMVGTNKLHYATHLLFNFTDALYIYTIREHELASFKRDDSFTRQRAGGCATNPVTFIPFTRLKLIHKWPRKCLIILDEL